MNNAIYETMQTLTTAQELFDYFAGLAEEELKTARYAQIEKHAKQYGIDILSGALGELLEPLRKKPRFELFIGAVIAGTKWLIKKVLPQGALAMLFGDSGSLKTFIAIAMAACTATDTKFYGYNTNKAIPLYIAAEGREGLAKRFNAWAQENKTPLNNAPIFRYNSSINLTLEQAAWELRAAVEDIAIDNKDAPLFAIIDTWSRSLGGDDSDTTSAAQGLAELDKLRARYPLLTILIVHHTGHSEKHRARGASLLHAAVDVEYRIDKQKDGSIVLHNTKQKDSELLPAMAFRARSVPLLAEDGRYLVDTDSAETITSLVLESIEYVPEEKDGLGKNQSLILEILRGTEDKSLTEGDLLEAYKKRKPTGDKSKGGFDRAIIGLEDKGRILKDTGFICLA